jgi:prepilin-type N-terminal cleavage/methylation domain-containing protein
VNVPVRRAESGFSLVELLVAMVITLALMTIVFSLMRQNQWIFTTESGVTAMNENVRAAVDLMTREVQAAGTGLRGMSAPILGVDGEGDAGDRVAILIGDPAAPIAAVKSSAPENRGAGQVVLVPPAGVAADGRTYRDERGRERRLYETGDRYVLYNDTHFTIVRVADVSRTPAGDLVVLCAPDRTNPRPKFGGYAYRAETDTSGALFARLDRIVTYRYDRERETVERRENRDDWAAVAHGIIGFQLRYRVLDETGALSEPLEAPPEERDAIRSVVLTIRARTPDATPGSPHYRETAERVEITPRNMRLPHDTGGDAAPPPAG